MSIILSADCLDRWLGSFDEFKYDFLRFSQTLTKAYGYSFDFDQESLRIAHENWKAQHLLWKKNYVSLETEELSHVKVLAILLYQLCCVRWIRDLHEYTSTDRRSDYSPHVGIVYEVRRDINGGRGTYLAFQFCIGVINWFEAARVDRSQPFIFGMTSDLEHDIMVYLLSERRDELATYLILKAVYTRDPKDGRRSTSGN